MKSFKNKSKTKMKGKKKKEKSIQVTTKGNTDRVYNRNLILGSEHLQACACPAFHNVNHIPAHLTKT